MAKHHSRPPIHRLSKKEIQWLSAHTCGAHSHSYLEHYNCYLAEQPGRQEKIGFLDIECTGLKADWAYMLTYCILDNDSGKIIKDILTMADIQGSTPGEEDKRLVASCIDNMAKFDRLVTYYGCLTPEHRVLTDDLQWRPAGDLETGDGLVAFSEHGDLHNPRKWEHSHVVHNQIDKKQCIRVHLSDGSTLTATLDHPFLASVSDNPGQYAWTKTNNLKIGSRLRRLVPVWDAPTNYEAGWLAGFFDGEGNINQTFSTQKYKEGGSHGFNVSAAQKEGPTLERAKAYLEHQGFAWRSSNYDPENKSVVALSIAGDTPDRLRFLGMIRPQRLLSKLDVSKLTSIKNHGEKKFVKVVGIEPVGEQWIAALGTTSKTYISEGFGSHNTNYDLPVLRSRALTNGLEFPEYSTQKHTDVYFIIKSKFNMSSKRQENACRVLLGSTDKTRIDPRLWKGAARGDKKSVLEVLHHNEADVRDLQKLYNKVKPYVGKRDTSI